jgi:hypothetical protein
MISSASARPNFDRAPIDTLNDGGRFSQTQPQRGVTQAFHFDTQMPQWHLQAASKNAPLIVDCTHAGGQVALERAPESDSVCRRVDQV